MKCPHCGSRNFSVIGEYSRNIEYDKNDQVIDSEVDDYMDDKEDSHLCLGCDADVPDNELIKERKYDPN